jgi:hypothetical protein
MNPLAVHASPGGMLPFAMAYMPETVLLTAFIKSI